MKYKAYQIAPEYQESPLCFDDDIGVEIYGNKDYTRHTSETFNEVLNCLDYGDFSDFESKLTGCDAARINDLCDEYGTRKANDQGIIAEALSIVTGQEWKCKEISGCCQSDWNYIYYRPDEWTEKALEYFEIEYFNTGEEWRIEDEEGNEEFVYTHEWRDDEKKRELAENIGANPEDITLYFFDGWTKTAKYKMED